MTASRKPSWQFTPRPRGAVHKDPFEGEFFKGADEDDQSHGRADALIRETLQNSLDARDAERGQERVTVRFAFHDEEERLPFSKVSPWIEGLDPHLKASGCTALEKEELPDGMSWLVIEDFGTTGLQGDVHLDRDPTNNPARESFYWFWRNIGRSRKSGPDRGRWGLGKTVFPSSSEVNTFFGVSRASDAGSLPLLFGQCIIKSHHIAEQDFLPEGFFHSETDAELPLPITDITVIEEFKRTFCITRNAEPGLSIVVPMPIGVLDADRLIRSALVHFFWPVIRGELALVIESSGRPSVHIDAETIEKQCERMDWNGRRPEKTHHAPPIDLARAMLNALDGNRIIETKTAGIKGIPTWNEKLFAEEDLEKLRELWAVGELIVLKVPLALLMRDGATHESWFHLSMRRIETSTRAEDWFIRNGMTITGVSSPGTARGFHGLVVISESLLSTLLGDAEGPAHVHWSTSEQRPDATFAKWKRRIAFIRYSLIRLQELLTPPPETLQIDLLQEFFSLPEKKAKRKRKKKGPGEEEDVEIDVPVNPVSYDVQQRTDGFVISRNGKDGPVPSAIQVKAAYRLPTGNSLKHWSPFDFRFDPGRTDGIKVKYQACDVLKREGNMVVIKPKNEHFRLEISGFDPLRDLYVVAREIKEPQ